MVINPRYLHRFPWSDVMALAIVVIWEVSVINLRAGFRRVIVPNLLNHYNFGNMKLTIVILQ